MKLLTHPRRETPAQVEVNACLDFDPSSGLLVAEFSVRHPKDELRIPPLKGVKPKRQDQLWEHTCFEVFFREAGASGPYWELNFSPFGDWNVYAFAAYREGMAPEERIDGVKLEELEIGEGDCTCRFSFGVEPLLLKARSLEYSLTSVIQLESGEISYWAGKHVGDEPDFHLAGSFTENLRIR